MLSKSELTVLSGMGQGSQGRSGSVDADIPPYIHSGYTCNSLCHSRQCCFGYDSHPLRLCTHRLNPHNLYHIHIFHSCTYPSLQIGKSREDG